MKLIITLILMSGCLSQGITERQHKVMNHVLFGVAEASLACDYGQTMYAAIDGWDKHMEHNAVLGPAPSTSVLTAYFAAVMVVGGLASTKAPEWLRSVAYTTVTLAQSATIVGNHYFAGLPWCGIK
jgi:hypothetical protein